MRITKLELFGFKSFPERTSFHFGAGISCVVGPNGCGKSNVVDALRWVIGEQSAKSLRGGEMLDVIFAGSSERKPVGFAEVNLVLGADKGEPFPGDLARFSEVQVTRRLHRSGGSEYLINQHRCRRRDIVDLFLDTGVGNNLYSFIEQGRIDKIVNATAAERRTLIDEAAGISRYKARREEAQGRLTAAATQLDRAADVTDEMARRLRTLERQVVGAAQFRRLRALVRQREVFLALARYADLSADRRALREKLRGLKGDEAAHTRELTRRETDLTSRREEVELVEAGVATWRDQVAELDATLRGLQSTVAYQKQRLGELQAQREQATTEGQTAQHTLVESRTEAERLSGLNTHDQVALEACEVALAAVGTEATAAESAVEQQREQLASANAEAAALRARIEVTQQRIETLRAAVSAVSVDTLQAELAALPVGDHIEADDLVTLRRQSAERLAALREQTEVAEREAVQRADAWQHALNHHYEMLEGRVAERRRAARAALKQRTDDDVASLVGAAEAQAEQLEAQAAQRADEARRVAQQQVDRAQRALESAEQARADALSDLRTHELESDELTARFEAMREPPPVGLSEVAPEAQPAHRVLGLDDDEVARLTPLLGDRLLLPVLTREQVVALSTQGVDGSVRVLVDDGDLRERLLGGFAQVDTLAQALAGPHDKPRVVQATGERVDPDGVVTTGRAWSAAAKQVERQQARDAIADRLEVLHNELETLREAFDQCEDQLRGARRGHRGASEALVQAEAQARDVLAEAAREARRLVEEAAVGCRLSADESRDALEAQFDQALLAIHQERDNAVAVAASMRVRVLGALRDEGAAALQSLTKHTTEGVARAEEARDLMARRQALTDQLERAAQSRAELQSLDATHAELQAGLAAAESRVEGTTATLEQAVQALKTVQQRLAELRGERAAIRERRAANQAAAEAAARRVTDTTARIEALQQQIAQAGVASAASHKELLEAEQAIESQTTQRGESWDRLERERERLQRLRAGIREAEQSERALVSKRDEVARQAAEVDQQVQAAKVEIEVLRRRIGERYQVSLPGLLDRLEARKRLVLEPNEEAAVAVEVAGRTVEAVTPWEVTLAMTRSEDTVQEAIDELQAHREALERLGQVNLAAIEEHEEIRRRHDELQAQRIDLEESVRGIRTAIAKMNRECRQRFRDAFDRVNESFQTRYPELVGGGEARLSLTNEDDLLETGVDIYVRPPGKRLQHLNLLSGGEKAMTAIALLLALFSVKPSPFCVLDEVDAPLDEANGARFNMMLQEMARVAQFIVVTHNRTTMECADTLYGVTMPTPGASRLVTVDID